MSLVVLLNEEGTAYRSALPKDIIAGLRLYGYPDIEAGTKRYIEKWNELAPHANTKECFEAGLAAALGMENG